jgi:HEAT repeat protein
MLLALAILALVAQARGQAGKTNPVTVFTDKGKPLAARQKAGESIGRVTPKQAPRIRQVLLDKGDDVLRALALRKLPAKQRSTTIKDVITILKSESNGGETFRRKCVRYLRRQAEFTAEGKRLRPDIVTVMRLLIRSNHEGVRKRAMTFLMEGDDPTAVKLLAAVLDGKAKLFTRREAIRYLAAINPEKHKSLLEKRAKDKDVEVRAAAIRALGVIPGSANLVGQFKDRTQPEAVRLAILKGRIFNPTEELIQAAIVVLKDNKESARLRAGCIEELAKAANQATFPSPKAATGVLSTIKGLTRGTPPEVIKVAKVYVEVFGKTRDKPKTAPKDNTDNKTTGKSKSRDKERP